jgi:hypothetical protein
MTIGCESRLVTVTRSPSRVARTRGFPKPGIPLGNAAAAGAEAVVPPEEGAGGAGGMQIAGMRSSG